MMRLIFGFLAFVAAIFLCAFAASQTFESWRIKDGVTAWVKAPGIDPLLNTAFDGAFIQAQRAKGVQGFGLTWVDDPWQQAGFTNPSVGTDLYQLSLNIDLITALGGYVVVRHQPWAFYGQEWLKDPALLLPPLKELVTMLKGKNLKRVALQLFGEPGAMPVMPPDVYDEELKIRTAVLEDAYNYCIGELRKEAPNMTFVLSPPGWAHLHEGKWIVSKYSNTIRAYDVYLWPWEDIEGKIKERYDFHRLRGEKMMLMEYGHADRSTVGTLEETVVLDRIKAACALWKIPAFQWIQAGT